MKSFMSQLGLKQKILQERRERQEAYDRLSSSLTSIKELIGNLSSHFDEELTKIKEELYNLNDTYRSF